MLTASDELKAWLPTAREIKHASLYTITLTSGQVFRWTDAGRDIVSGGNTFIASGPQWAWDQIDTATGTETASANLTVNDSGTSVGIGSLTVLQAIVRGLFDRAHVLIEAAFMSSFGDTSTRGTIVLFSGRVATVSQCGRAQAQLEVRSTMEVLDMQLPRVLYQSGCSHTLYDAGCTLNKADFTASGAVGAGSTTVKIVAASALGHADDYYAQGIVTFTSGANSGLSYAVKGYSSAGTGTLTLERPTLLPLATGDTFTVSAGCDKTQTTCTARFDNLVHFGGTPFVPVAEAAI